MDQIIYFDEYSDAASSIELASYLSESVDTHPHNWKWLMISIHNSLQAFMVLSLMESGKGVLRSKNQRHLENGNLDSIKWLYQRLKNPDICCYMDSVTLPDCKKTSDSIGRIIDIRNQFIHFMPRLQGESLLEYYEVTINCSEVLLFLFFESRRMHMPNEKKKLIEYALIKLNENLKNQYESISS